MHAAAYLDEHISWLGSKLEEYKDERCFIITHLTCVILITIQSGSAVIHIGNGSSRVNNGSGSEGALIHAYENHIDILGVDLKSGKYLPIATYRLF